MFLSNTCGIGLKWKKNVSDETKYLKYKLQLDKKTRGMC